MEGMHILLSPVPSFVYTACAFIFGAMVGSFLNVCIHRLPRGMSVSYPPRSFCPSCNTTLKWSDNVPILSWVLLGGKCRYCKEPIAPRYAIVELLTALLFLAAWLTSTPAVALVGCVFMAVLVAATFIDLEGTRSSRRKSPSTAQ